MECNRAVLGIALALLLGAFPLARAATPVGAANWSASGTTNATLKGRASTYILHATNSITANGYLSLSSQTDRVEVASHALTLNGVAVGGSGVDAFWFTNSAADMEGGTVYYTASTNATGVKAIQFSVNNLTNLYGAPSVISAIGDPGLDVLGLSLGNADIQAIGIDNLTSATVTNSYQIYAVGDGNLLSAVVTNSSTILAEGRSAGDSATIQDSSEIFALGDSSLRGATIISGRNIYAIGKNSLSGVALTNSGDIYAIGGSDFSPILVSGDSLSHVFLLGSGSIATNSNDYVFGDAVYNYKFPGANLQAASPISVVNTNRWYIKSITEGASTNVVITWNGKDYTLIAH